MLGTSLVASGPTAWQQSLWWLFDRLQKKCLKCLFIFHSSCDCHWWHCWPSFNTFCLKCLSIGVIQLDGAHPLPYKHGGVDVGFWFQIPNSISFAPWLTTHPALNCGIGNIDVRQPRPGSHAREKKTKPWRASYNNYFIWLKLVSPTLSIVCRAHVMHCAADLHWRHAISGSCSSSMTIGPLGFQQPSCRPG